MGLGRPETQEGLYQIRRAVDGGTGRGRSRLIGCYRPDIWGGLHQIRRAVGVGAGRGRSRWIGF